jgi:hypothetical protein
VSAVFKPAGRLAVVCAFDWWCGLRPRYRVLVVTHLELLCARESSVASVLFARLCRVFGAFRCLALRGVAIAKLR